METNVVTTKTETAHEDHNEEKELSKGSEVPVPPAEKKQKEKGGFGETLAKGWQSLSSTFASTFSDMKQDGIALNQKFGETTNQLKNLLGPTVTKKINELANSARHEASNLSQQSSKLVSDVKHLMKYDTPVFGSKLKDACRGYRVPVVVDQCISKIEKEGLSESNLWILPFNASSTHIPDLKAKYNSGTAVDLNLYSVRVAAGLLVHFLKSLPEPLIPLDITHLEELIDPETKAAAVSTLIYDPNMPKHNSTLLKRLFKLLNQIYQHQKENGIKVSDMVTLIGPTIFAKFGDDNSREIISLLITHWELVFDQNI
eukprot:TRINITY_DN4734_c0_g1_i2.p1 TRINITY_DN4734_c0_g1~~TRINITY_DN4734_c0_g1_i2.p1  ORF type:complete len:315 (-),score=69.24 TRINITY_DN4734_c0_g1_i2:191-1135(-)